MYTWVINNKGKQGSVGPVVTFGRRGCDLIGAHEAASGEASKVLDRDGSFKGDLPYIMMH